MENTQQRLEDRNRAFQRSVDSEDIKRRREVNVIELRKKKRMINQVKRSRIGLSSDAFKLENFIIDDILLRVEPKLNRSDLSGKERLDLLLVIIAKFNEFLVLSSAVELLRKLASSENSTPLEIIADSDILPRLGDLLNHSNEMIKFNVCWVLTNLTVNSSVVCVRLAELGVIETAGSLANEELLTDYSEQAIWLLSNFAGDSIALRNRVFCTGIGSSIIRRIHLSKTFDLRKLSNMVWLLSNLFKFMPIPSDSFVKDYLQIVPSLITSPHEEILADVLNTIHYISRNQDFITEVYNTSAVSRILHLLTHDSIKIKQAALAAVCNLTSADDIHVQRLIENKLIENLYSASQAAKNYMIKDILFVLANVVSGNIRHASIVIQHQIFPQVVLASIDSPDREVRNEALFVVAKAARFSDNPLGFLDVYFFERLLNLLNYNDSDVIILCVTTLQCIFETAKGNLPELIKRFNELAGTERLEKLLSHQNLEIYNKVSFILQEYINGDIAEKYMPNGTFYNLS